MIAIEHLTLALLTLALIGCEQPCAKTQEKVCHGTVWGEVCECVAK